MDRSPNSLQTLAPVERIALNGAASINGSSSVTACMESFPQEVSSCDAQEILRHVHSGQLLTVSRRRRNGLILLKQFYAEFAGPGAAVGGVFDKDCHNVIPIGDLSLLTPSNHQERQEAYRIRRQWIRLTQQFTDNSIPVQRAQMILNQFETYFDPETVARVPDDAFALLVGVMPDTVRRARRTPGMLNVKVKA